MINQSHWPAVSNSSRSIEDLELCTPDHLNEELKRSLDNANPREEIVRYVINLITVGADLNANIQWAIGGYLHRAAQIDLHEVIPHLIENGVDPSSICHRLSPLHVCAKYLHLESARAILAHGGDPNIRTEFTHLTPLHLILNADHPPEINDPNQELVFNPIRLEFAQLLISFGADVNMRTPFGQIPVIVAIDFGYHEIASAIIENGAILDDLDPVRSLSALHIAAKQGNLDLVRKLVEYGAKVDVTNSLGITPRHLAEFEGHKEVVEFLRSQGSCIEMPDIKMTPKFVLE